MKILITGHKGYIGSHLIERIHQTKGIQFDLVDLKDGRDVMHYEGKPNLIIHLAGQAGVPSSNQDPINDARQNILTTIRMIQVANKNNARLIFTTSGASKDPESPYGLSKQTAEKYIQMFCKDYVILRLSSVFGNKPKGVVDTFINSKECIIYGDGKAVRDFVHVHDIVRAIWTATRWQKGVYELGSGKGISVMRIAKATKKPIKHLPARLGEKKKVVLQNTTPDWSPEIDVLSFIKKCIKSKKT